MEREEKRRLEKAEQMKALGYSYEAPKLRELGSVPVQAIEPEELVKAIEAPANIVMAIEVPVAETTQATGGGNGTDTIEKVTKDKATGGLRTSKKVKSNSGVKPSKGKSSKHTAVA